MFVVVVRQRFQGSVVLRDENMMHTQHHLGIGMIGSSLMEIEEMLELEFVDFHILLNDQQCHEPWQCTHKALDESMSLYFFEDD